MGRLHSSPGRHGEDQAPDPYKAGAMEMNKKIKEGILVDSNNSANRITSKKVVTIDSMTMVTLREDKTCKGTITVMLLTRMEAVRKGKKGQWCSLHAGEQAMSVHISLHPRANVHMVENNNNIRYNNKNNSVQDLTDNMSYYFCFMLNRWSFFLFFWRQKSIGDYQLQLL